jgi:thioesterase domain-containing protein
MHLPAGAPEVPIGFHLGNTRAYVVDPYFQPVPAGVPGELCLGGDALARGYLKRPDLQAHKFITPPLAGSADARWYRTGDSVRWLPDGALEYLGRIDDQVKIRGFRIEPGEIESVLSTHGAVKQAAVVVREDVPGEKTIVAYLVSEAGQTEPGQLRAYLREQLPEYMIPASFVFLEKLPLTFNGKVDRKALPAPERTARSVAAPEQPQAVSEVLLAELWTDVLNQPDIGVEDNFFDLGGNSLLAIKLIAEIKRSTGLDLPVVWVFANPTIRMQARQLHSAPKSDTSDILINIRPGNEEPPLYIIHDGHGGVEYGFRLAAFMKAGRHVYGIQVSDLSQVENRLRKVEVIAEYYVQRLLKHQPEGPFHLGGFSGGAAVTFEMARQLKALGKEVGMVAIFDAFPVRLNRFTYQRIGLLYVLRSVLNLFFSSGIGARQKWNLISTEVPKIIHQNWMRIKLKQAERESDTVDNPGLKIFRIMRVAIDSYQFKPYAGPLVFVRALENPARYLRNSHFGWGHYAKPVRVYDLPGNHYQLFARPDNLRAIAGIVETHLAESEAARPGGLKYPSVAVNDPA